MSKILYIGFDVGDAETIINYAQGDDSSVQPVTMPGRNQAGLAIPTMYGYSEDGKLQLADAIAENGEGLDEVAVNFKRCPSDIIEADSVRKVELTSMSDSKLWQQPEMQTPMIQEYCEKLNTFIKIILTHKKFQENALAMSAGCIECKVCVGHPTRWSEFDVRIYKALLGKGILGENTYLGLKLTLNVESESRAAFLYIRDAYKVLKLVIRDSDYVGLIDIGSSTIDISVIKGSDSRNCVYNDGHNFLGARAIDYLILEYCLEKLRESDKEHRVEDIFYIDASGRKRNPAAWDHALINCRFAKEALFSSTDEDVSRRKKRIDILEFPSIHLTYKTLVDDICNRPIAGVLKKYCNLTDAQFDALKNKSWKEAFKEFLLYEKQRMESENISLTQIFLTGSASRMSFVKLICADVFQEISKSSLLQDANPSNAIANGLARVGVSEDKASEFTQEMNNYLNSDNGLRAVVNRRISELVSDILNPIIEVIKNKIVVAEFERWKDCKHKSIDDMLEAIERDVSNGSYFISLLKSDASYIKAISSWLTDKVGKDVAVDLKGIAQKYGVYSIGVEQLSIFDIDINGISVGNPDLDFTNEKMVAISQNFITVFAGIISSAISAIVIAGVAVVASIISDAAFSAIIYALIFNPEPVVTTIIGAVLGVGVIVATIQNKKFKSNKGKIAKLINAAKLPAFIRRKTPVDKLMAAFDEEKEKLRTNIRKSMNNPTAVKQIVHEISGDIAAQVEDKAAMIKYEIINQ